MLKLLPVMVGVVSFVILSILELPVSLAGASCGKAMASDWVTLVHEIVD